VSRLPDAPLVAVLCTAPHARVAAAGVALALARAAGRPCALAGALGVGPGGALSGLPAARRAAVTARRRELPASASGRLVWIADRRGPLCDEDDLPGRAAAFGAELGCAAAAANVPAAIAYPVTRTTALDRVLAWHDAVVVVRDAEAVTGLLAQALESVAVLGRPVAELELPRRLPGLLAHAGVAFPPEAAAAVALLVGGVGRRDG